MPNPWSYAKTSEHSHQAALFMWANMAERFGLTIANDKRCYTVNSWAVEQVKLQPWNQPIPQLKWLHAVHNQGHGDAIRGAKAKAEGVKAGVSDIFLPYPARLSVNNAYYHGLYIELKPPTTGKTSPEQIAFQSDMTMLGYKCEIARGWLDARDKILAYLQISS